jgi:hypothetical protein
MDGSIYSLALKDGETKEDQADGDYSKHSCM